MSDSTATDEALEPTEARDESEPIGSDVVPEGTEEWVAGTLEDADYFDGIRASSRRIAEAMTAMERRLYIERLAGTQRRRRELVPGSR